MKKEDKYLCPITRQIMIEPVVDALGNTYDKEAIQDWLKTHDTAYDTEDKLPSKTLLPNN